MILPLHYMLLRAVFRALSAFLSCSLPLLLLELFIRANKMMMMMMMTMTLMIL